MKIVLANYTLIKPGGTEVWTYTIAKELSKRGHEVYIYGKRKGEFLQNFLSFSQEYRPGQIVDLSIVNHAPFFSDINAKKHINISHSPFIGFERLVEGYDKYFSISKEIQELEAQRGFKSELLLNPIDLSEYHSRRALPNTPKTALFYSHYESKAFNLLKGWCDDIGLKLIRRKDSSLDNSDLMNEADIIISVGRGALEGLACGRMVIGADDRKYMGAFGGCGLTYDLDNALHSNFTGRNNFVALTQPYFKKCVEQYSVDKIKATAQEIRNLVNVENIVDKLLC